MWETTIRIEQSEAFRSGPDELWTLLSSPAAWSLFPDHPFMFSVSGAEKLRFHIGPYRDRIGFELLEIADEVPGAMVRLRSLPTGRQQITMSIAPGRRGTTKISAEFIDHVPRQQKLDYERKRRKFVKGWLAGVREVIEGRARWPGDGMRPGLVQASLAQPPILDAECASAAALINADPVTVWDAVHSPETARSFGDPPPVHSGYVPGTPHGERGEMQYFVRPSSDGKLIGQVVVVTEVTSQRSAVVRVLGGQFEQQYLLTPESDEGPTRLDLTLRWAAPKFAGPAEVARNQAAESAQACADGYRSLIEAALEEA